MNIIFMRHGESTHNINGIISDKEIYNSLLTQNGKIDVIESVKHITSPLNRIYISPLPRTIETASYVLAKFTETETVIDDRIREIFHGKFSGQQNNEELNRTRELQVAGDYFIRFGEYGENKFDIEFRLCSFLYDLQKNNSKDAVVLVVSHGSIISFMKRILGITSPHISTGKIEEFDNVDFSYFKKYYKKLKNIKN